MKTRTLRNLFLLVLGAALLSCATSYDVSIDFDENFDFDTFQTFAVVTPADIDTMVDDLAQARVESAIKEQFELRGYEAVAPDQADLLISYFGTTEEGTDIQTYNSYNDYYHYARCYRCGGAIVPVRSTIPTTETRTVEYTEGMLMVDLIEPGTETLKWRGQTIARFGAREATTMTPLEREEVVSEAVASILENFPPGS